MYYKSDWGKAKANLEFFWKGEDIGRPCMAVFAPRNENCMQFPELHHGPWTGSMRDFADNDTEAMYRWWTDPDENLKRMKFWFENTYFGGEAIPATYVNWGASAGAAFFGSPPVFRKTSVWYPALIDSWEDWKWEFDERTNRWWKIIWDIIVHLAENAEGNYLVGMPEFGNAADNLSLMRGMDNLAMDCFDYADDIKKAIDFMDGYWVSLHEKLYQLLAPVNEGGGVLPWMSLWAPGRIDQLACDFSSIISPDTFKEIFVYDIETMGKWMEYGMYHLDGQACMRNMLDILLTIDCIKAIEFTPGAGSPPTLTAEYIPRYRKVLESGRRLYLLADPGEVRQLCEALPSRGLYLCSFADSRRDADIMIENTYKWCKK
jgi:5-methyltetrahydrofolate--homocysteine methyltransferase